MHDTEDQEHNVTQYLIPANVSIRFELWEGFGFRELKICVIVLIIGGLLFYFSGLITKTVQYNLKEMPVEQTIGLKNDANTIINGDSVIKKVKIIPDIVRFLFIIVPTVLAYYSVKRDRSTGMSLIDSVTNMRAFSKKQKRYYYKYGSGSEA